MSRKLFYYDSETLHQFAPYTQIRLLGILWEEGLRMEVFKFPFSKRDLKYLQKIFGPDYDKVGFNCINFDNLVLFNHDIHVHEEGMEDGFMLMKAVRPDLPAFDLKFINWWLFGDPHWPEFDMENAGYSAADASEYLMPYLRHDLIQTRAVWQYGLEYMTKLRNKGVADAYMLDRSMGEPIRQMTFDGGLWLNKSKIIEEVKHHKARRAQWIRRADKLSKGRVKNVNSRKQLGGFLDSEGFALNLSNDGDFSIKKADLRDLESQNPVAKCGLRVKDIDSELKYFNNYHRAIINTNDGSGWIPTALAASAAATRRFTSGSMYKINFQNPSKAAKKVWSVPPGWRGWYIDLSQVENIVHIFESKDRVRRKAYELDPEWNEYVWLTNQILGTNKSKDELDEIPSKFIPHWSVYKLYKTVKLALNFGMGVKLFCTMTGLDQTTGRRVFAQIHQACPAIMWLQDIVARKLTEQGFVQDVFGHIYTGEVRMAYKVVAYLIQGCGTGSLPKAMIRSNYETLQQYNEPGEINAVMCGTTHDEIYGLVRKSLGEPTIDEILRQLMFNMTDKYSPKFDNIPLRAKLYLSETNAADAIETKLI